MANGKPNCPTCHGKGGFLTGLGWRRCVCTRPTPATAAAFRRANARDGRPFQLPLDAELPQDAQAFSRGRERDDVSH